MEPKTRKKRKITNKPQTEIELFKLQSEYLENPHDLKIFHKYFELLYSYTKSLILKKFLKGKIFLSPDKISDITIESVLRFLNQYTLKGRSIVSSFAGILQFKILEVIYSVDSKQNDSVQSLNQLIDTNKRTSELEELPIICKFSALNKNSLDLASQDASYFYLNSNEQAIQTCLSVIKESIKIIPYEYLFRTLLGIQYFFEKRKFYIYYKKADKKVQELIDFLLVEIKNRLKASAI